jgi:hypothetical protein
MKYKPYDKLLIGIIREICYEAAMNGLVMPSKAIRFLERVVGGVEGSNIDKQVRKNVAAFIFSGWVEEDGVRFEKIDDYYDEIPCSLKAYIECDDYYRDDEGVWNTVVEKIMEVFVSNEKEEKKLFKPFVLGK